MKRWLSTWSGIGHIVTGMERQGFGGDLRRLVNDGWTAAFYSHQMLAVDAPIALSGTRRSRYGRRCTGRVALEVHRCSPR